ncbi:MAG: lmo0937 family membrane protein [Bacteroidetes bacterium]|nr:MAG: lmo0937 family membrane protein [Bacteroidota bacterium]
MKNAPYVLAAILVILWLVGFLLLNVGSIVHLLLVLAGVMVALKRIGEAEFF